MGVGSWPVPSAPPLVLSADANDGNETLETDSEASLGAAPIQCTRAQAPGRTRSMETAGNLRTGTQGQWRRFNNRPARTHARWLAGSPQPSKCGPAGRSRHAVECQIKHRPFIIRSALSVHHGTTPLR